MTTTSSGRKAIADWAPERLGRSFIPPNKPWHNGYIGLFNAQVRDECLTINIVGFLAHRVIPPTGKTTTTSADDTARAATRPRQSLLWPAPTDETTLTPIRQIVDSVPSVTSSDVLSARRVAPLGKLVVFAFACGEPAPDSVRFGCN